ncbi:hypothetical protein FRC09_007451 [Ceratobasidium sp. 395]|nr:hypothetical protein FRC09_007451 [Ceratobasidium sp. 395]
MVSEIIEQKPDLRSYTIEEQFERLIVAPMQKIGYTFGVDVVIVIDGLDECEDKIGANRLLQILFSPPAGLPIRIFITTRPSRELVRRARNGINGHRQLELRLHDIDHKNAQNDIKTYLEGKLQHLGLNAIDMERLVLRSGVSFIYAATLVAYISQDIHSGDVKRLNLLQDCSVTCFQDSGKQNLDMLFASILEQALHDNALEDSRNHELMLVLCTVICQQEPLTLNAVANLWGLDFAGLLRNTLASLLPVLRASDARGLAISFDKPFAKYLVGQSRHVRLCRSVQQVQERMAQACLEQIMVVEPHFNICSLESSYLPDRAVLRIEDRLNDAISLELLYACRHWGAHLELAGNPEDLDLLRSFLSTRLLLWMEILNLKHCMHLGVEILYGVCVWLQRNERLTSIQDFVRDAWMFATAFSSSAASESTPHIYLSALQLWPEHRPISTCYGSKMRRFVNVAGAILEKRASTVFTLTEHVKSAIYSPRNPHVVAGALGSDVLILDVCTGRPKREPLRGHKNKVQSIAWSPDGTRIASGSDDRAIRIWDAYTGESATRPLLGHSHWVHAVAYSPNGAHIVSGSHDFTIRTWDAHTGNPIGLPLKGHTNSVISVAYSPDGASIASGSWDKTIRIWNSHSGQLVGQMLEGHGRQVNSVVYSPDGAYIASASNDYTIRVWSSNTHEPVGHPLEGHKGPVTSVAFSPGGSQIASSSVDNTIRFWEAHGGKAIGQPIEGHNGWINSVAYSPDGSHIVSGSNDNTIRTWQIYTREPVVQAAQGHRSQVYSVGYSPDGNYIVSGSGDNTVRIWNAGTGNPVSEPLEGHAGQVNSVTYSPDGAYIASCSHDKTIRIWDAQTGKLFGQPLEGHMNVVNSVIYSPDGRHIASASDDNTIRIWAADTGGPVGQPFEGHKYPVTSIFYSPSSEHIVSGSFDRAIYIWNAHTGQAISRPIEGHTGRVYAVAYSPSGSHIASASVDNTIHVWNSRTRKLFGRPFAGHQGRVNSIAYSPDGTYIASGSNDKTIRIWDAYNGTHVGPPLEGHTGWVNSVAYSPQGTFLVSGSDDGTIRVWSMLLDFEKKTSKTMAKLGHFATYYVPGSSQMISGFRKYITRNHKHAESPGRRQFDGK